MKTHSGKVTRLKMMKDNSLDIQVKTMTQKEQQFSLSSACETLYKKKKISNIFKTAKKIKCKPSVLCPN